MVEQIEISDHLLKEILDAPFGHVVTVLGENLNCEITLDLIEQNTPKPGTKFERKVIVSANGLPIIRAIIRFDKQALPQKLIPELLKKKKFIGTLLNLNGIPTKKTITSLFFDKGGNSLFRVYEIRNGKKILFEVSEEIKITHLNSVRGKCLIPS